MQILQLDVNDERAVRDWYEVTVAAAAVDLPGEPTSWRTHRAALVRSGSGVVPQTWLARDEAGTVLGGCRLELPVDDNTHAGAADVLVHPQARRRGVGTALVEHLCARLCAAGRRLLIAETAEASGGPAFAAALGAERGVVDVRRVLDVRPGELARFVHLREQAAQRAGGYSLVRWAGPVPEEYLADVAGLLTRMSDAPMDDLEWGQESWTPERVRRTEEYTALAQDRQYVVAARAEDSDRLVALTTVFVRADHPEWSSQGDTAVLPEHRGHRLGMLVKAAMVPWLLEREPEVRRLETWNAGSNAYMIAVNEALGYRVLDRWAEWQLRVGFRPLTAPGLVGVPRSIARAMPTNSP